VVVVVVGGAVDVELVVVVEGWVCDGLVDEVVVVVAGRVVLLVTGGALVEGPVDDAVVDDPVTEDEEVVDWTVAAELDDEYPPDCSPRESDSAVVTPVAVPTLPAAEVPEVRDDPEITPAPATPGPAGSGTTAPEEELSTEDDEVSEAPCSAVCRSIAPAAPPTGTTAAVTVCGRSCGISIQATAPTTSGTARADPRISRPRIAWR
jgi:hypothetical protein